MPRAFRADMGVFTIGVEEEYQLVDPVTGDLRSRARAVLGSDWSGDIRREMQASTIEIGTRVCANATDAAAELDRLRVQADAAAGAEDLRIVAAGLHPFSDWRHHSMSDGSRYRDMAELYGRIARDEHNYGMHIHVAVEGDRVPLINTLRGYIPHLLALSCSSPYYEGEDTGYASYRMVLWRRWPGAGPPPRLPSEAAYRQHVDALLDAGVLPDERSIYWMIRRHPEYPTVEFRMCDVCPRLEDAAAIAGLARVLVAAAADGALVDPMTHSRGPIETWDAVLADDCWRAARWGLHAPVVTAASGTAASGARAPMTTGGGVAPRAGRGDGALTAAEAVLRLLDAVQPIAEEIGEGRMAEGIAQILQRGTGADRIRSRCDDGDLPALVHWLTAETVLGAGLDRRREQRPLATNP